MRSRPKLRLQSLAFWQTVDRSVHARETQEPEPGSRSRLPPSSKAGYELASGRRLAVAAQASDQAQGVKTVRKIAILIVACGTGSIALAASAADDLGSGRRVQNTTAVQTVEVGDTAGHMVGVVEFKGLTFFASGQIASHVNGVSIGEARFEPFFAEAESLGAAIFVHALHPAGQDRIVGAFIEQAVCFPGDIGLAAASMITGGIAERHPKLKIAFSHGGGVMSILLPRLVHAWNKIPKAHESLRESPAVAARRFYYDQLVFDPTAVNFLLQTFGTSQICVGTDYPFAMGDFEPMKTLEGAKLERATLEAITAGNAKRFLGL